MADADHGNRRGMTKLGSSDFPPRGQDIKLEKIGDCCGIMKIQGLGPFSAAYLDYRNSKCDNKQGDFNLIEKLEKHWQSWNY